MPARRVAKYRNILIYGTVLALLLFLLQWLKLSFIIIDYRFEIYAGAIAVTFTMLGIWLALKLAKPSAGTVIAQKEDNADNRAGSVLNQNIAARSGLSDREVEVLALMAEGLSNREIASRLFVSQNTVKTHASRVFEKMEVKRRTQAVDKARKRGIIT